jgi:murein DD-endopeptidase MepM/ murein hydrolase activator NlpD
MKPGSIPSWVRKGARLTAGVLIGRLGSSGNSGVPHLHFQVMDSPSFADSTGLPFVFDTQLLAGTIAESAVSDFGQGAPVTIDRTEAGVRRNQMSARDGVFGYNLSHQ